WSRVLITGHRSGPVSQATGQNRAILRFHQRAFQAAGTGIEQQDFHVRLSWRGIPLHQSKRGPANSMTNEINSNAIVGPPVAQPLLPGVSYVAFSNRPTHAR